MMNNEYLIKKVKDWHDIISNSDNLVNNDISNIKIEMLKLIKDLQIDDLYKENIEK